MAAASAAAGGSCQESSRVRVRGTFHYRANRDYTYMMVVLNKYTSDLPTRIMIDVHDSTTPSFALRCLFPVRLDPSCSFPIGLKEEQSLFAWAKTGVWMTADTEDAKERRLGDWFRIGFEPLFVDYTKAGSWFAAYALVEVRAWIDSSRPGT